MRKPGLAPSARVADEGPVDEEEGGSDGEEGDDATPQSRIATSLDSNAVTLVTPRQNESRMDEVVEAELPGGGMHQSFQATRRDGRGRVDEAEDDIPRPMPPS